MSKLTHHELVEIAARWLKNKVGCRVVLKEHVANTVFFEIPDVVGWKNGKCYLVECKTSTADFKADFKKPFRQKVYIDSGITLSLGNYRFYFTEADLIPPVMIPEKWGLYEVTGRYVDYKTGTKYTSRNRTEQFKSNKQSEITMLLSKCAKLEKAARNAN